MNLRGLSLNILRTFTRHGVSLAIGLATSIILARALGPQGTGRYALAILLPTMLSTILELGLASGNVYFISRGGISLGAAFRTGIRFWLTLSSIGVCAGSLIILFRSDAWLPAVPQLSLWLALTAFPILLLQTVLRGLLQGIQDFRRYNLVLIVPPASVLTLVVVTVLILDLGMVGALIAFVVGNLLGLFSCLAAVIPLVHKTPNGSTSRENHPYWTRLLRYSWKVYLSNALAFLNYRADLYLASLYLDPASVGVYFVAVQLSERMWVLSQVVSVVVLPRLAELHDDQSTLRELTPLIARWVFAGSVILAAVVAAFSLPLVRLLFGDAYIAAVAALLWLLPGVVIGGVGRVLSNDIAARGRPELNVGAAAVVLIINIGANIVLIPRLGISGAALATTIAYSVNALIKLALYAKLSANPWWKPLAFGVSDWQMLSRGLLHLRRS